MPDDTGGFILFEADDIQIYVAQDLLEKLEPGTRKLPFYIDGYGRFWLTFAEPWTSADGDETHDLPRAGTAS
jgi:hypothetical protein